MYQEVAARYVRAILVVRHKSIQMIRKIVPMLGLGFLTGVTDKIGKFEPDPDLYIQLSI